MTDVTTLTKSEFTSPIYGVQRISVYDCIGQRSNPNAMSSKSFAALQVSIFNSGYAGCITVTENPVFNPEKEHLLSNHDRIKAVIEGGENDNKSGVGQSDITFATQVSDDKIREMFRYQIVDGQQRSSVIRLGTLYSMEDPNMEQKAAKWAKGEDIPYDPGKEMLKYLAWRENYTIPCAVLTDKSEVELMSMTVLMNQAKGSHGLDSMKDIVYNLINIAGMSPEWVARNLFMDLESVKRMTQLSGLKGAYDNLSETDMAWSPEADDSFGRKERSYLNREASKYVTQYLEMHPDADTGARRDIGDIQEFAISLGWDREAAKRVKQSKTEVAPNGSRREGRIHNGFVPDKV